MISLSRVSKSLRSAHSAPRAVLEDVDLDIPTDRRVALLGPRQTGKSLILQMLAGLDAPDGGLIERTATVSPVANARKLFHARLPVIETLRFLARIYAVPEAKLAQAVEQSIGGSHLSRPYAALAGPQRQALEAAVVLCLPFDCYLLDDAHALPAAAMQQVVRTAGQLNSGLIFATTVAGVARSYGECAIVLCPDNPRLYNDTKIASEVFEAVKAGHGS